MPLAYLEAIQGFHHLHLHLIWDRGTTVISSSSVSVLILGS